MLNRRAVLRSPPSLALSCLDSEPNSNAMNSYQIELPETAFSALRKTPAEFLQEMKCAAVVKWYETGMISQDKAAEIAGMRRYEFLLLLARYDVSAIQLTSDLLSEELRHARGKDCH
jgi:predicted HTH domain antitoxin